MLLKLRMDFKKAIKNWAPAILLMLLIFYLSSQQRVAISTEFTVNFLFFKSLHVAEYAILFLLIFRGFYRSFKKLSLKYVLWFSILLTLTYAISDEIHQTFVPTRTGSLTDVFIDSVGIFLAKYYTETYIENLKKYI